MPIITEANCAGLTLEGDLAGNFDVLQFHDASTSFLPKGLRTTWVGQPISWGTVIIGRCSGVGAASSVRFDRPDQSFGVGRFTSIGSRLRVILGGFHETRAMSTSKVEGYNPRLTFGMAPTDVPLHVEIGSDVWFGDDVTLMAGSSVADGCVIGTGSLLTSSMETVPYGVYAGRPARLLRPRFPDAVTAVLTEMRWWEWSVDDLTKVQHLFVHDLSQDAGFALSLLGEIAELSRCFTRTPVLTWRNDAPSHVVGSWTEPR